MVAMRGVNDDEFIDMVEFCIANDFTLRFIETMPVGCTGQHATADHYLPLDVVRGKLERQFHLTPAVMPGGRSRHPASHDTDTSLYGGGPARYFRIDGTDLRIGFITPISQHFCETCNRVRLAADGTLYLCLGQNDTVALRPLLRAGISDAELEQAIVAAIGRKPERHEFGEAPGKVVRFMALTGG